MIKKLQMNHSDDTWFRATTHYSTQRKKQIWSLNKKQLHSNLTMIITHISCCWWNHCNSAKNKNINKTPAAGWRFHCPWFNSSTLLVCPRAKALNSTSPGTCALLSSLTFDLTVEGKRPTQTPHRESVSDPSAFRRGSKAFKNAAKSVQKSTCCSSAL